MQAVSALTQKVACNLYSRSLAAGLRQPRSRIKTVLSIKLSKAQKALRRFLMPEALKGGTNQVLAKGGPLASAKVIKS